MCTFAFAHSDAMDQIAPALVAALADIEAASKNRKNAFIGNSYADLNSVLAVARPALAAQQIAILQPMRMVDLPDGTQRIAQQTLLMHGSGQWIGSEAVLEMSPEKGKSSAQVFGSCVSYYRRYQLQSLCGMGAEDDDGNAAGGHPPRAEKGPAPKPATQPASKPANGDDAAAAFIAAVKPLAPQVPPADYKDLLAHYQVTTATDIPADKRRNFFKDLQSLVNAYKEASQETEQELKY